MVLSEAGRAALAPARTALEAIARAAASVAEIEVGHDAVVRLGTCAAVVLDRLPAILGGFHASHPEVALQVVGHHGREDLLADLVSGEVDLAVVPDPGGLPSALLAVTVVSDHLALVVPSGHPWGSRRTIRLPAGHPLRLVSDRHACARGGAA